MEFPLVGTVGGGSGGAGLVDDAKNLEAGNGMEGILGGVANTEEMNKLSKRQLDG